MRTLHQLQQGSFTSLFITWQIFLRGCLRATVQSLVHALNSHSINLVSRQTHVNKHSKTHYLSQNINAVFYPVQSVCCHSDHTVIALWRITDILQKITWREMSHSQPLKPADTNVVANNMTLKIQHQLKKGELYTEPKYTIF